MRKWQQEKILEIIKNLEILHSSIQTFIVDQRYEESLKLLTECQESAIIVGNVIEEVEGKDCLVIKYLEEYCENLYIVSQEMQVQLDTRTVCHMLYDNMQKVKNFITQDIAIRKEIVFLPYKASMWDSLESIYLAALEDPDSDAFCIPIPYFEKNPDGSFKKMCYDVKDYPPEIQVVDWMTYSFEERRPDVIYIHNPYDEFNFVTSVHPRFYASNLCRYTNMLVYVPYFVLDEIDIQDKESIEAIKHFCYMPGTIYTDRVVLQSENIRQIYMNEYAKVIKEQGKRINKIELEKRFLGIGSPKYDKVLNKSKKDIIIPDDWRKLIEKQDGSWKKIIFYNTSISGMLQYGEKMIEKIEYVFSVFKDFKDEVALWWRPHPLIEATITSMREDIWKQYEEVLKKYKEENWGIYDNTSDVHRAINISDAYYGDKSSLIYVYQKTGKPVMLHNVETNQILF